MRRAPLEVEGVEVYRCASNEFGVDLWRFTKAVSALGFIPVTQALDDGKAIVLYALHPSLIRKPKKPIGVKP